MNQPTSASSIGLPQPRRVPIGARQLVAALGILCVALAGLGVLLPGVPTTIFLIVAAWCFAKSFPSLERRLLRNRLFRPFMLYVDRQRVIPLRDKWIAGTCIAGMSGASCVYLLWATAAPVWVCVLLLVAAFVGIACVCTWDRSLRRAATAPATTRVQVQSAA